MILTTPELLMEAANLLTEATFTVGAPHGAAVLRKKIMDSDIVRRLERAANGEQMGGNSDDLRKTFAAPVETFRPVHVCHFAISANGFEPCICGKTITDVQQSYTTG